jgi:hypothetical protein
MSFNTREKVWAAESDLELCLSGIILLRLKIPLRQQKNASPPLDYEHGPLYHCMEDINTSHWAIRRRSDCYSCTIGSIRTRSYNVTWSHFSHTRAQAMWRSSILGLIRMWASVWQVIYLSMINSSLSLEISISFYVFNLLITTSAAVPGFGSIKYA